MGIIEDINKKVDALQEKADAILAKLDEAPAKPAKKAAKKKAAKKKDEDSGDDKVFMQAKEFDSEIRKMVAENGDARTAVRQAINEISGDGTKLDAVDAGDRQAIIDRAKALLEEGDDLGDL